MSSPKHLWSGNWEDESQTAQSSLPAPPPPVPPLPSPEPPPAPSTHLRRIVALTVVAALVLVGVVWAISSSGSDTKRSGATGRSQATTTGQQTPTVPSASVPGTTPPGPTGTATGPATSASAADSLGLQLALVPVNRVIVQAVVPGSAAAQVGIGADDLLESINGQPVTSPGQANAILAKLPKGSAVTLILVQGSAQIQATIQESNGP